MKAYKIKSPQPNCKSCGKLMGEWNPFATEHEHVGCAADRISDGMMEIIRDHLKLNKPEG